MIVMIENRPSRLTPIVINLYFKARARNSLHTISAIDIAALCRRLAAFSVREWTMKAPMLSPRKALRMRWKCYMENPDTSASLARLISSPI